MLYAVLGLVRGLAVTLLGTSKGKKKIAFTAQCTVIFRAFKMGRVNNEANASLGSDPEWGQIPKLAHMRCCKARAMVVTAPAATGFVVEVGRRVKEIVFVLRLYGYVCNAKCCKN